MCYQLLSSVEAFWTPLQRNWRRMPISRIQRQCPGYAEHRESREKLKKWIFVYLRNSPRVANSCPGPLVLWSLLVPENFVPSPFKFSALRVLCVHVAGHQRLRCRCHHSGSLLLSKSPRCDGSTDASGGALGSDDASPNQTWLSCHRMQVPMAPYAWGFLVCTVIQVKENW